MPKPDLNLLLTLDVLLTEGSVARAARRLRLSPSAMSQGVDETAYDDGRPTFGEGRPRSRTHPTGGRTSRAGQSGRAGGASGAAPCGEARSYTTGPNVHTTDQRRLRGKLRTYLIAHVGAEAPGVRLHFLQKANKDSAPLRDGAVDLETGVVEKTTAQELRVQAFVRDRLIGVVRKGHPLTRARSRLPDTPGAGIFASHGRGLTRGRSRKRCSGLAWNGKLSRSSAASRRRSLSRGAQTWSPQFPNDIRESCAPACKVFRFRSPRQSSRCRCSGIHVLMPILRIAGCAAMSGRSARRSADGTGSCRQRMTR